MVDITDILVNYFFSINIKTVKEKEYTKVLHSAVSSKAGRTLGHLVPTLDETYNSKSNNS